MNLKKILLAGSSLVAAMGLAGNVFAQTWTIDSVDVLVGSNTVTVPWQFTADGGGVQGLGIDISFNDTLLTPVIDDDSDCFDEVETILPPGCTVVGNNIRVTTSNLPGTDLVDQSGQIVFTIDPAAAVGDFSLLSASVANATPPGTSVEVTSGRVDIVDAPPAILDVDPTSINFGNVRVDQTSPETPIAICNDAAAGSQDLTVSSITVSGTGFAEGPTSTCEDTPIGLEPGACCNYHVTFSPDAAGGFNGNVAIETNVGDQDVALSGEGTVSDANLTIDPADWVVSRDIGDGEICLPFELENTGTDDSLTIDSAALSGGLVLAGASNGSAFSIRDDGCTGQTLVGGATCEVEVCFNPSEEGTSNDSLDVTSDVNEVSAALLGNGTATADVGVFPDFSTGPDDVRNIGVGEPGTTVSFTDGQVTNTGSADADVACEFTSNPDGLFSTDPSPLAGTVAAGGDPIGFALFCDLPGDANEGDVFTATLSCTQDGEPLGEHFLSCGVSTLEPVPVNTLQPLGLALFALLMLLIGGISIRLFRAS